MTGSKCANCSRLEVWLNFGISGGVRYLCEAGLTYEKPSPFGRRVKYAWPCSKGLPPVKECAHHKIGMHYSRKPRQTDAT